MTRAPFAAAVLLLAFAAGAVEVRSAPGALHGFPSMSDDAGRLVADGELVQERAGSRLAVRGSWRFRDGREATEEATFDVAGSALSQRSYSWLEKRGGETERRFEVDFASGEASAAVRREGKLEEHRAKLDLARGRAFAGYGVALAASQLPLDRDGDEAELTLVGFTPEPRTVTLTIRREGEDPLSVAGRRIPADRYRLRPKIPAIVKLFVKAPDGHLWFTRTAPRALLRARQNLVAKDDPVVTIDVIPRAPGQAPEPAARRPPAR